MKINEVMKEISEVVKFGTDIDFGDSMMSKIFKDGATIEGISFTIVSKKSGTKMEQTIKSKRLTDLEEIEELEKEDSFNCF